MSDTDLKEKEDDAVLANTAADFSPKEQAAFGALADNDNGDDIPYGEENESRRSVKSFFTKKKAAAGGTVGIVLGVIFTILSILQGPGQLAHFAHLLTDFHSVNDTSLMNSRAGNLLRYGLSVDNPTSRNLGFFGNIIADHYTGQLKAIGIEPKYENRRIRYLEMDTNTAEGKQAHDTMKSRGFDPAIDEKGISRVDFKGTTARERRQAIGGMVDLLKLNGVSSAVSKRLLKLRAAVSFHPLKNIVRGADESILQYHARIKEERDQRRATGVNKEGRTASAKPAEAGEDGKVAPGASQAQAGRSQAAKEANTITRDLVGSAKSSPIELRTQVLRSNIAKGVGVVGIVALTCSLQQLGDTIYDIKDANIVQPLMRIGTDIVASGSQEEAMQDINLDVIGAASADLYDQETKTSWREARSIQGEMGEPQTGPDMPDSAKPGVNRPPWLDILDATIGKIPGGSAVCGGLTSFVGGFILDGAGWALNATGPIGFALNASSTVAVGVVSSVFMDQVIQWLAGEQVNIAPKGALLGNAANYGWRLATNDAAIAHGGTALSDAQSAELRAENNLMLKIKLQHESFYARYFDLNETHSLAAKALYENTSLDSPSSTLASIIKGPSTIFSSLARTMTPKASAAEKYDYGFPEFGFSLAEMDDPKYEDPIANASFVEPRLATLNERYKKCFKTSVDPATFKLISGKAARYDEINNPANNCSNPGETFGDGTTELKRYRFYLADLVTAKSLACYQGLDEQSCSELGFDAN